MTKKKKIILISITAVILLLLLLWILYYSQMLRYKTRFFPGTWINGMDVSQMTPEEVEGIFTRDAQNYTLTLAERNDQEEVLSAKDIGLEMKCAELSEILEAQGTLKWITGYFEKYSYEVAPVVIYNEEMLKAAVSNLKCAAPDSQVEPQDAYIDDSDGFKVIEEVKGSALQEGPFYENLDIAIKSREAKLDLESTGCYKEPRITTESKEIRDIMAPIEKLTQATITYEFGETQEVLDSGTISRWIILDENGQASLDQDKVKEYVEELASKYNTVGIERSFQTSYGDTVTVDGGIYGYKIDVNAEFEALMEAINNGESQTREPVYSQKGLYRGEDDIGNTYVEISLRNQEMFFYKNGELVIRTDIVSGNVNKGQGTPDGVNYIVNKMRNVTLIGPDYESPVNMWMKIIGSVGIHDAPWKSQYGGNLYQTVGSHGCINTPYNAMNTIFENIEVGTPVILYY